MTEIVLPGTYVTVKAEGLIAAGQVISGYIGIVGTASKGQADEVKVLGSLGEARELFGDADPWVDGSQDELTLIRSLELIYANGGGTVYAVRAKAPDDGTTVTSTGDYERALEKLENEPVNIVLLAGQSSDSDNGAMASLLAAHLARTAQIKRERIGLIGSNAATDAADIAKSTDTLDNERLIFVAPGLQASKSLLPGAYTAAAVAGLISSLPVQASPTNKTLNLPGLAAVFDSSKLEQLVSKRVLTVEQRNGFRVVKGITTSTHPAWRQITTRRIVDYATYGVRSACDPYIGKLNNERVRGAMQATLDAFLTRMVDDEALVSYELEVSATRVQETAGEAVVTLVLRPTFSIDFVKVTMYLV